MRKLFNTILTLAAGITLLASCQEKAEDFNFATSLSVDKDAIELVAEGGASATLNLTANGDWLAVAPDWLKVTPGSGSGNAVLTVTAPDNLNEWLEMMGPREQKLYIYGEGTKLEIPIKQLGLAALDATRIFKKISSAQEFEAGKAYMFTFTLDDTGALYAANAWPGTPGSGRYEYWCQKPTSVVDEEGAITRPDGAEAIRIIAVDGGYVLQEPGGGYLYQSKGYATSFYAAATAAEGDIWTVEFNEAGQAVITNVTEAHSNGILQYLKGKYQEFACYADYPAQDCHPIVLYKDEAAATDEVLAVADLTVEADATSASIPVTSNRNWSVRNHDEWITSFAKTEAGDAIEVTFGVNTSNTAERTASFTVIGETTNKVITLTQKAAATIITAKDKTVAVGRTTTAEVTCNTDGDMSFVSNDTAIATVDNKGVITGVAEGETTITVTVEATELYPEASKDFKVTVTAAAPMATTVKEILEQIVSTSSSNPSAYEAELAGAVVSYANAKAAYIEDATGAIELYMANNGLTAGDVITGKVSGTGYIYNGLPEITSIGTEFTKTAGGTIPATVLTVKQLIDNFDANISRRIVLKGVKVTDGLNAGSDRDGAIEQDGSTLALRDQNKAAVIAADAVGDLVAFPLRYKNSSNDKMQLAIWESSQFTPEGGVETTLSAKDVTVQVGKTVNADVTTNSPGALSYESENVQIATVDNQGVITGVAEGEANITVTVAASGDYEAKSVSFKVTVTPAPTVEPSTVAEIVAQITATSSSNPSSYSANLTGAVVSYVNGKNVFLEDASGAILLYLSDANHGLKAGDTISGKVSGTGYKYNGLPEITSLGTEYTKGEGGTIPLTEMTIAALNENFDANISRRIVIKGVTVTKGVNGSVNAERNGEISQNGSTIVLRDQTKSVVVAKDAQGDVIGYPLPYNTTKQFGIWVTSDFTEGGGGQTPETTISAVDKTVQVGQTVNAEVTTNSPGALRYSSDNTQVATVDAQGVITGVAAGEANITVTVAASGDYAEKSATFRVTVTAAPAVLPSTVKEITDLIVSGSTSVEANLAGAVVSYVNGKYAYLEDESGAILVFKDGHGLATGETVSGPITVTGTVYKNLPEITALSGDYTHVAGGTIPATEITIADLLANYSANLSRRVIIKGVTVTDAVAGSDRKGTISQNGSTIALYAQTSNCNIAADAQGDIVAHVSIFNSDKQLAIYTSDQFTEAGGGTVVETTLTAEDVSVQAGASVQAKITTNSNGIITLTSRNEQVATVSSTEGVWSVTGVSAGETEIAVSLAASGDYVAKSTTFKVTVTEPAQPGGNDGSLEKPYTASEAAALAASGDTGTYYITGKVTKVAYQFNAGGTASVWLDENGQSQSLFEGYKLKYIGNVNWVAGNALLAVGDELIINGKLKLYSPASGDPVSETDGGYIVSWNGKTQALSVPAVTATPNNDNKQIAVAWTAATGTNSAVSYAVKCGTQSYSANAAGSHVFTMDAYGTYEISVEASASDAIGSKATASATLTDPTTPPSTNSYAKYSGAITEGDYIIYYSGKAMKNTIASNRFSYAEVTPANDVIADPDASIVWHISASGDYWVIYNAAVQKYAGSTGSKNQGKLLDAATSDNALWTVTGSATYEFENKARAAGSDPNNKWLRNNGTYGFACYATSTGGALTLFKKQ